MELVVGDPYAFTAAPKEGSEPLLGNEARKFRFAKYRGKEADGDLAFDLGLFVDPDGVDFVSMKGVPMNNNGNNRNNRNNGNNNSTIADSVIGIRNNDRRRKSRKSRTNRKDRKDRTRKNRKNE